MSSAGPAPSDRILAAAGLLARADSVVITAGAGMSVKEKSSLENVYVDPDAFAHHYPFFAKQPWGKRYRTSYETMGLGGDPTVPADAKLALTVTHMDKQGWVFEPCEGYALLNKLLDAWKRKKPEARRDEDVFVVTSNVDMKFAKSGFFAPERIYTPQGEWKHYACLNGPGVTTCRPDSVFESRPMLDAVLPHISEDGRIADEHRPRCPNCGGQRLFGNVRGGAFFRHEPYAETGRAFITWCEERLLQGKTIAVIEIGAGFNTPVVTRFPDEALVAEAGGGSSLIRINPSDPEVPSSIPAAVGLATGWDVLGEIETSLAEGSSEALEDAASAWVEARSPGTPEPLHARLAQSFGKFDFREFYAMLARDD